MMRFVLRGLAVASMVCAATAVSAQQTQSAPNADQPKTEHGGGHGQPPAAPGTGPQNMGSQGMGMGHMGMGMGQQGTGQQAPNNQGQGGMPLGQQGTGQQAPGNQGGMGMGQGGMQDMHKMMHPTPAATPPAPPAPSPQTGQAPAPSPQCPSGTTVQMDANGQHVCK